MSLDKADNSGADKSRSWLRNLHWQRPHFGAKASEHAYEDGGADLEAKLALEKFVSEALANEGGESTPGSDLPDKRGKRRLEERDSSQRARDMMSEWLERCQPVEITHHNHRGDGFAFDDQARIVAFQYCGATEQYRIHYDEAGSPSWVSVPGEEGYIWKHEKGFWTAKHKYLSSEGMLKQSLNFTVDETGIHTGEYFDWDMLKLPLRECPQAIENSNNGNLYMRDHMGNITQFSYAADRGQNKTYVIEFNGNGQRCQRIIKPDGGEIKWETGVWREYDLNGERTGNRWYGAKVDENGIHLSTERKRITRVSRLKEAIAEIKHDWFI